MKQYRTLKLCAYRHESGALVTTPAQQIVEIGDEDNINALLELGAIELFCEEGDEPLADPVPDVVSDALDGDQFAAWVAAGAGAREVVAWIGESAVRAEIAKADPRPSVQKAISAILDAPVEPVIEETPIEPAGDDEDAVEADAGDEEE